MKQNKIILLLLITTSILIFHSMNNVYAEETQTIEIEIKYTDGDRAEYYGTEIIVYQDFNKSPILKKELIANPDSITVEKYHKYKIEVYVNGIFVDVGYIQLDDTPVKMDLSIPLTGGIQFEIFYQDGVTPINRATFVLKSFDNSELGRVITNDKGQTGRYWIQSTVREADHYIAEVYLDDIFLKSLSSIKIQPGIAVNQKIITNIPKIIEDLITINLYDDSKKIKSTDGDYTVTLSDMLNENNIKSKVNSRGDAHFSSLKPGMYLVKITTADKTEDNLWPETFVKITGDVNDFSIFKYSESSINEIYPYHSCECISFRLDDIQDYWLAETQIKLINLFEEKNIPLSVGVIGNAIGLDDRIKIVLDDNILSKNIEIVSHSWNNEPLTTVDDITQEKYIVDTNKRIKEIFGVTPTAFIPPENLYNEESIKILKKNGFTHLSSHIQENSIPLIDDDIFYITPAITETAVLATDGNSWKINDKDEIKEKVIQSIKNNGYALIMMHPQEFTRTDDGEYGLPNQNRISELGLLLDDLKELNSKFVKISEVKPYDASLIDESKNHLPPKEISNKNTSAIKEEEIDSCNCVAFRFDNVQDYWLNDVQIEIMQTFIENKTPLTIGIIADVFGSDQKMVDFIKKDTQNQENYLTIATKGIGLTSYTEYSQIEQSNNLKESIEIIESIFNKKPHVLIPPKNEFNSDTLSILKENQITHISTSLFTGESPPFELTGQNFYRFPQTSSTGKYSSVTNLFEGNLYQQTLNESISSIDNFGFAVISLQVQEFSKIENSTYVNSVNTKQINELKKLFDALNAKGIKIVPISEINSNVEKIVPVWIKHNAKWWSEGQIDDDAFVQGLQFLIKEKILLVSGQPQGTASTEGIPDWIKSNAGWWADGIISEDDFVNGIKFLVEKGIVRVS